MNNRSSHLKRTYGLSEDAYDAQARSQNYLCAVCHEQNPIGRDGQPKILAVDHNHRTETNRGLLCDRCNKVLGFVKDSQELLLRLLFYLRSHDGSQIPYIEDNPETRARRDVAFEQSLGLSAPKLPAAEGLSEGEQVQSSLISLKGVPKELSG